jgi:hypothetical protein
MRLPIILPYDHIHPAVGATRLGWVLSVDLYGPVGMVRDRRMLFGGGTKTASAVA